MQREFSVTFPQTLLHKRFSFGPCSPPLGTSFLALRVLFFKSSFTSVPQSSFFDTTPRPAFSKCPHFNISARPPVVDGRRNSQRFQICFCYKWTMHPAWSGRQLCSFLGGSPGTRVWPHSGWEFQDGVEITCSNTQECQQVGGPPGGEPIFYTTFLCLLAKRSGSV